MLGDLDDRFFQYCKWYGLFCEENLNSLILEYEGLRVPTVITVGPGENMQHLLNAVVMKLPRQFYCHMMPEHEKALKIYFDAPNMKTTLRMGLTREEFAPLQEDPRVRPLTHADTGAIMEIYQHYPDNFFEPYQLESGYYYGLCEHDQLLAIAGIHVISREDDIAALGNIVTHPDHRRQGFSSVCLSHLIADLFRQVSRVALNVRDDNFAAQHTFAKLGFTRRHTFVEGLVEKVS